MVLVSSPEPGWGEKADMSGPRTRLSSKKGNINDCGYTTTEGLNMKIGPREGIWDVSITLTEEIIEVNYYLYIEFELYVFYLED